MTANITPDPIDVDYFCGGGGASLGVSRAFGKPIDIAVNHNAEAIEMHATNHPETLHLREDVWHVDLAKVAAGRPIRLMWASPDCTHHSKAKGGKPRKNKIRGLCWVVVRWAKSLPEWQRPLCIMLENVEEFQDYGPLGKDGHPIKARKGELFRRFVRALERLGYTVDWDVLIAADYGAPTIRKRFYLVARRDGKPIAWPEATHAKNPGSSLFNIGLPKWRSAAECIDWSIPCPSIFDRKKPLADNTCKRVAEGIRRYVIDCAEPFLVEYHSPKREGDNRTRGINEPLPTQTTENRFALVTPSLVVCNHAGGFRGQSVEQPMPTVCASRDAHGLVSPVLVGIDNASSEQGAWSVNDPLRTITGENRFAVVAPTLIQTGYGERDGQAPRALDIQKPLGTVVGSGKHALCAAFIAGVGGRAGQSPPRHPGAPMNTITAKGDSAVIAASLVKHYTGVVGQDLRNPLGTVTAVDHHSLVYAFLTKYYGTGNGSSVLDPMGTVTSKDRMGLVFVVVVKGTPYVIVDIGLRMLQPRELARAQGFPDSYVLTGTKTSQVARIGNSVCPDVAHALVRANFPKAGRMERAA